MSSLFLRQACTGRSGGLLDEWMDGEVGNGWRDGVGRSLPLLLCRQIGMQSIRKADENDIIIPVIINELHRRIHERMFYIQTNRSTVHTKV